MKEIVKILYEDEDWLRIAKIKDGEAEVIVYSKGNSGNLLVVDSNVLTWKDITIINQAIDGGQ